MLAISSVELLRWNKIRSYFTEVKGKKTLLDLSGRYKVKTRVFKKMSLKSKQYADKLK